MNLTIPDEGCFDAVIFDCDGTLVDSMPLHYRAWRHAFESHGAPFVFSEARHYANAGKAIPDTVAELNQEHGSNIDPLSIERARNTYLLEHHDEAGPIEPVVDFARSLEGRMPMSVASGSQAVIVENSLERLGIRHLFTTVITPVDVEHGKPAPDMLLLAARRMGVVPDRCLVLEDGPSGIVAAEAAGMMTVLIPCPHAARALERNARRPTMG